MRVGEAFGRLQMRTRLRATSRAEGGFTLIELVIAITILTILAAGIIPLVKINVKRQKEAQLRDALREMREAIKEFKRDTVGMEQLAATGVAAQQGQQVVTAQGATLVDPRSHVIITDQTLFGIDNPDRYPPKLETLVEGVKVKPRVPIQTGSATGSLEGNALDKLKLGSGNVIDKKKVYLRAIPVDPMTGKAEWDLRSCYDAPDSTSWGGENVFDVRSKSNETALNGEKYNEW